MKAAIWVTRSIEVAAVVVEPANAIAMRNATHATCSRRISTCRAGERRPVRDHDIVYEIDGGESRALATIGAFRVVAEGDLHDIRDDSQSSRRTLKHLEKEGLIRTSPLSSDDRAVTLTDRGVTCSRPTATFGPRVEAADEVSRIFQDPAEQSFAEREDPAKKSATSH
jgi:hypothetical protein